MKKTFYIIVLGLLWFVWFTRAAVDSVNLTPATQTAISGSTVTFTITGHNGTGGAYLKYVLPQTASYMLMYQSANITPINNGYISPMTPDPIFAIPANSNFSVTLTAKLVMMSLARSFSPITTTATFGTDQRVTTVLTSAVAQITPIADLMVKNILTGDNPSFSGDNVYYYITLQNIWSAIATGISFMSDFPVSMFANTPTATFNGTIHSFNYIDYLLPGFVWTGLNNLNPWDTKIIILNTTMKQNFAVGTTFNQIAKTTTASPEYTTGNNSATATGIVQLAANIRVTKTLAAFTGYNVGDQVIYTITYGNSGGKPANNVVITDLVPAWINIPVSTFTIGTLPVGSGWTIILTWTFGSLLTSWYTFVNTANISTTSTETVTGNNSATATWVVKWISNVTLNIIANNLSNPALDNAPYGSGPNAMIQAISGDIVQLTITYANFGNTIGANATIGLSWTQGFVTLGTYNGTIGTLPLNTTWTLIITWMVGPKNYISFAPTARLAYNSGQLITDSVTIQEPLVCGDGLLTRNETCDTLWNLGVLYSGQVCENQQGVCVLVTQTIMNNACINYQYTTPLGWITTGQSCSSVNTTLMNSTCSTMTGSTPTTTNNGYDINYTCKANNATSTTPISIDCGNGTSVSWSWSTLNGTCSYASWFNGNAQCRVGSDVNNAACRVAVSPNQLACNLDPIDGNVVVVEWDNNSFNGDARFRCSTVGNVTASSISIDCGNGDSDSATNVSSYTKTCNYDESNTENTMDNLPRQSHVTCKINNSSNQTCQQSVIVDQGTFWRCGDGKIEWYEECDVKNMNEDQTYDIGDGQSCRNCRIVENPASVGCFNIWNANLSVQENELLPFRWMVDGDSNTTSTPCNSSNQDKIKAGSLTCTFQIYNMSWQAGDDITVPCKNSNNATIFNYFSTVGSSSFTHAYGKYTTTIDNDITNGVYWEYKIRLAKVNYKYCDGTDFVQWTPMERVCETNFTVTKPYLIQKSSFGLTPKTTTDLSIQDFYGLDGVPLITSTQLDKIMVINTDTYEWGNTITTMMDNFVTKYSKLAIKYTTVKSEEGNDITAYKVPGQDIVVFKGNGTLVYTDWWTKTKPFTVIVDGPNLTINWSITNTNAMFLLNKWDIKISEPTTNRCEKTQVIKWIFVTKNNFVAGDDLTNNDTNKQWCPYGWLDVQWILIWNNIDALVTSRRSQLNHWFITSGPSDAIIQANRRNEIFNGASVLIEYSPSLWSALPPGASEFTKALDIYKQ